jgi:hypothetical protein
MSVYQCWAALAGRQILKKFIGGAVASVLFYRDKTQRVGAAPMAARPRPY